MAVKPAFSAALPDIGASAQYQRNFRVQEAFLPAIIFDPNAGPDDLIPVRFGADNQWSAGLTLNQRLFEYGVFVGIGAAGRFKTLESERARGVAQTVVTSTRRSGPTISTTGIQISLLRITSTSVTQSPSPVSRWATVPSA